MRKLLLTSALAACALGLGTAHAQTECIAPADPGGG